MLPCVIVMPIIQHSISEVKRYLTIKKADCTQDNLASGNDTINHPEWQPTTVLEHWTLRQI